MLFLLPKLPLIFQNKIIINKSASVGTVGDVIIPNILIHEDKCVKQLWVFLDKRALMNGGAPSCLSMRYGGTYIEQGDKKIMTVGGDDALNKAIKFDIKEIDLNQPFIIHIYYYDYCGHRDVFLELKFYKKTEKILNEATSSISNTPIITNTGTSNNIENNQTSEASDGSKNKSTLINNLSSGSSKEEYTLSVILGLIIVFALISYIVLLIIYHISRYILRFVKIIFKGIWFSFRRYKLDKDVQKIISLIYKFKPMQKWSKESGYQADLARYLKQHLKNVKVELQRGSSRPDIVVNESIAIEIKGPTRTKNLETITSKIIRYRNHFNFLIIVLFDVRVSENYLTDFLNGLKDFPNLAIIYERENSREIWISSKFIKSQKTTLSQTIVPPNQQEYKKVDRWKKASSKLNLRYLERRIHELINEERKKT